MNVETKKPYIIGETAYNHEGNIEYLYKMIDEISEIGLNAVKFHLLFEIESYVQKKHPLTNKLRKWIFSTSQWSDIIDYANKKRLDVVTLCDDVKSMNYIIDKEKNVSAVEIHATGLNDFFLLKKAAEFRKTVIVGIGGSTIDEISYAIDLLRNCRKKEILLMYGFQGYPTNYVDINLAKMCKIKDMFNLPIGYADHTGFGDPNNETISVMAAAMGISILEKHYTLDYGKERIDYHAAVGKKQMLKIKDLMEIALKVYGDGNLGMSEQESAYGNTGPMKKAIVARKEIRKGDVLSFDNLWFKRTEEQSYIKQNQFLQLIGLEVTDDIKEDEVISYNKIRYEYKRTNAENFTHIKRTGGK